MWTLKKDGKTCGYYDSFPEAVAAMTEERMKEDGTDLRIEEEDANISSTQVECLTEEQRIELQNRSFARHSAAQDDKQEDGRK